MWVRNGFELLLVCVCVCVCVCARVCVCVCVYCYRKATESLLQGWSLCKQYVCVLSLAAHL